MTCSRERNADGRRSNQRGKGLRHILLDRVFEPNPTSQRSLRIRCHHYAPSLHGAGVAMKNTSRRRQSFDTRPHCRACVPCGRKELRRRRKLRGPQGCAGKPGKTCGNRGQIAIHDVMTGGSEPTACGRLLALSRVAAPEVSRGSANTAQNAPP